MRATHLFLFMALSLATVSTARADDSVNPPPTLAAKKKKNKKQKKAAPPEKPIVSEVTIPMAKGELEAEVAANQAQRDRANAPRTYAELGVSSWKPKRATTYSRIPGTSDFDTKGIPSLDATIFAPLLGRRDLYGEGGIGFLALQRTGTISSSGLNVPQEENGYILTLRLGVSYSPYKLFEDRVAPYIAAALLPSILITRTSSFDSGASDTGLPFELGLGLIGTLTKTLALDLGATQTLGKVQDSDFHKFAVRAGLRIAL